MRWWAVVAMLVAMLAGCSDSGDDRVPVLVLESDDAGEGRAPEPRYTFVLFGEPLVKDDEREVSVWVYYDGTIRDAPSYTAMPGAELEPISIYRLSGGGIGFRVIAEKNDAGSGFFDVSECPSPDGDAVIRVKDRDRGAGYNIEINYGCSG